MATGNKHQQSHSKVRILVKTLLALCLIGAAGAAAWYWLSNPPKAKRRGKGKDKVHLVNTKTVKPFTKRMTVDAMGTVEAVDRVGLTARVSGRVTKVNADLTPGSYVEKGATLVTVEQRDYRLALEKARAAYEEAKLAVEERKLAIRERKSEIAKADKELILEKARQEVARSEYRLFTGEDNGQDSTGTSVLPSADSAVLKNLPGSSEAIPEPGRQNISNDEKSLILRKPHVKAAEAALDAAKARKASAEKAHKKALQTRRKAKAAMEEAQLALERTTVEVPLNAVVQAKNVAPGDYVAPGQSLATLVNTDRYWVTLNVPVDQLRWLEIPREKNDKDEGSKVRIALRSGWDKNSYRTGRVVRLKPGLEKQGRMAQVVVEVDDPRSVKEANADKPALLLDSFVEARIQGNRIRDVVKVPRTAFREGNRVWVLSPQNTLAIKEVEVKARTPDHVFVSEGLNKGDKLITSDISTPVEGMKLRDPGEEKKRSAKPDNGKKSQKSKRKKKQ